MQRTGIVFSTDTLIPFESFDTFGLNAKPNSINPLGYFGTGLKYAVAIILRAGGSIFLTVGAKHYEFYVTDKEFRGKNFRQIKVRERTGLFRNWRSRSMPFTTELGKNWELWKAYRELESNTRDEGGISMMCDEVDFEDTHGTKIYVFCSGFTIEDFQEKAVFLYDPGKVAYEDERVTVHEGASDYLYYRGVRVYDLRYPSRFTYNFKTNAVTLSEDRTAANAYSLFWIISQIWMTKVMDKSKIYRALSRNKGDIEEHFEGHDITFSSDYEASTVFRDVARQLTIKGFASPTSFAYHTSFSSRASASAEVRDSATLTEAQWKTVGDLLYANKETEIYNLLANQLSSSTNWDDSVPF